MNVKRSLLPVTLAAMTLLVACHPDGESRRVVGQMQSDRVEITAEFSEPIIERAVREGESVVSGQLLISQDKARIDARIAEADAQRSQLQARLDELVRGPRKEQINALRASVSGARDSLAFRKSELERAKAIYDRDLAAADVRDRAQAAYDDASATLARLEAQLDEMLTGTTAEELRQAEAAVLQAEARIGSLQIDRERHDAHAPQAGVVDSLLLEPGERPTPGQPMAILLAGKQSYARVFVPVELRARIVPGTRATVWVDGIESPLEGVVRWVSSEAAFTPYFALTEEDRGRLAYAAKVDIVDAVDRIPDGIPVDVAFESAGP